MSRIKEIQGDTSLSYAAKLEAMMVALRIKEEEVIE